MPEEMQVGTGAPNTDDLVVPDGCRPAADEADGTTGAGEIPAAPATQESGQTTELPDRMPAVTACVTTTTTRTVVYAGTAETVTTTTTEPVAMTRPYAGPTSSYPPPVG